MSECVGGNLSSKVPPIKKEETEVSNKGLHGLGQS